MTTLKTGILHRNRGTDKTSKKSKRPLGQNFFASPLTHTHSNNKFLERLNHQNGKKGSRVQEVLDGISGDPSLARVLNNDGVVYDNDHVFKTFIVGKTFICQDEPPISKEWEESFKKFLWKPGRSIEITTKHKLKECVFPELEIITDSDVNKYVNPMSEEDFWAAWHLLTTDPELGKKIPGYEVRDGKLTFAMLVRLDGGRVVPVLVGPRLNDKWSPGVCYFSPEGERQATWSKNIVFVHF